MRELVLERGPWLRRAILSGLVIAVPVAFVRVTLDPFNVPKLALLTAGVVVVAAIRVIEVVQGASWRGIERLGIPALLLVVPLLFSWTLSPYRSWALLGLQPRFEGLLPYLVVVAFGLLLADAFRGRAAELAFAFCWAGAVVGAYAVIQTVGMDPFEWSLFGAPTEAISTTGNPNFTGGFLGTVLPVGLALALTDPARRRVTIRLMIAAVLGWIVARSQGGWAAGIAGCALVGGSLFVDRNRLWHWAGRAVAIAAAAVTVGVVLVAMVQPDGRFTLDTARVRAGWWLSAGEMGLAHPVAGRGPNSFALEGVSHRPLDDALEFQFDFPDDPHSVPLSMFANLGLPGFLGFLGILGWGMWFSIRRDTSLLQVGFFGAVIAYFVQSSVSIDEMTLRVALWTGLAGLVSFDSDIAGAERKVATRSKKSAGKKSPRRRTPLRSPGLVGLTIVVGLFMLAWPGTFLIADTHARAGLSAFASDEPAEGRERFASALGLRDSADYRARLAFELRDLALDEETASPEYFENSVRAFRSFIDDAPYVFSIVTYGRLLDAWAVSHSESGDPEAVAAFQRALGIDPLNPVIRTELATALVHLDKHEEALAVLEPHLSVVPPTDFGPYWAVLAVAAAEAGAEEIAREAITNSEAIAPGNEFVIQAERALNK